MKHLSFSHPLLHSPVVALPFLLVPLQPASTAERVVLEPVSVTASDDSLDETGEVGAGFRAETAAVGPLGEKDVLDTPYTISTVNSVMIDNAVSSSLVDILKYLPSAQMEARGGLDVGRPQTRGMESSVVANNHLDGFNIAGTTAYPMELFERVEVIASLTGALYGPASPAGNFNFISKRPTEAPMRRVNLAYGSGELAKAHVDLGGRVGANGVIGYRINLLHEEGEGYVAHSNQRRELAAFAFDLHLNPDTVLQVDASHYAFEKMGYPAGFSYGPTLSLPSAPDPSDTGFGISGAGLDLQTETGSLLLKHRFSEDWRISLGVSRQIVDRGFSYPTHSLTNNLGDYSTAVSINTTGRFTINSNQVNLNGKFQTGTVTHDLVLASTGFKWNVFSARNTATTYPYGTSNISDPNVYDSYDWSNGGRRYHASSTWQQSVTLGDTLTFNEYWSLLAVASHSWLNARNYSRAGARTSDYDDEGISPTLALMYKPRPNMTTYLAYADSLQQGDSAPAGTANEGAVLSPYRSEQYEAGFKWRAAGMDSTIAVFRIERPFAYTGLDNIYKEQGLQVNHGLELTASGEPADGLALYSGVTFLNPQLRDTSLASTEDKRVVGVPKVQANLLVEYRIDALSGLVLTGNLHHTGKRAGNDTNSTWADAYSTLDLGVRYTSKLAGRTVVWRLAVNNVTDEHYWASIFPGSINGTNASASAFLGAPRELRSSVSFDL
jgi:iron complex outermembrane receptor protein